MEDGRKYYRYEFLFDSKKLNITELDYFYNQTLNETNTFVNKRGAYKFYMYSDSVDNLDMFLCQISEILSQEMHVASNLYHLASGRFYAFDDFWKEYNRTPKLIMCSREGEDTENDL